MIKECRIICLQSFDLRQQTPLTNAVDHCCYYDNRWLVPGVCRILVICVANPYWENKEKKKQKDKHNLLDLIIHNFVEKF